MISLDASILFSIVYLLIMYVLASKLVLQPLRRILDERRRLIQGRATDAQNQMQDVEQKTAAYAEAVRKARQEAYLIQERARREATDLRTTMVDRARADADAQLESARRRFQEEADRVERELMAHVPALADRFAASVFRN